VAGCSDASVFPVNRFGGQLESPTFSPGLSTRPSSAHLFYACLLPPTLWPSTCCPTFAFPSSPLPSPTATVHLRGYQWCSGTGLSVGEKFCTLEEAPSVVLYANFIEPLGHVPKFWEEKMSLYRLGQVLGYGCKDRSLHADLCTEYVRH
jgi:hypothetical protein